MILVDTSIWIDHLHRRDLVMQRLLDSEAVLMHPFVYGEIALGSLRDRQALLLELSKVPLAPLISDQEVLVLVEAHKLYGSGIGLADAHLLASVMVGDEDLLWTKDRRLAAVAAQLGVDAASI